jgi:small membrane protein
LLIPLFLTAVFGTIFLIGFTQWREARAIALATCLLSVAGAIAAWNADFISRVAGWVGVGRGADLVLYVAIPVSMLLIAVLYGRVRRAERSLTQLARATAIATAQSPRSATSAPMPPTAAPVTAPR